MNVPDEVARLLTGRPTIGEMDQAFPFLTVDRDGNPHSALLSRAELDVDDGRERVFAAIASRGTRANILRSGRSGFIAIGGDVAHHIKLALRETLEANGLIGCAFEIIGHKPDTLQIPLEPMRFQATDLVARVERWDVTARLLRRLMEEDPSRRPFGSGAA